MQRIALFLASVLVAAPASAQAPDFGGRFSAEGQNGTVVVAFQAAGNGQYTGTMSNGSLVWQLQGEVDEEALMGTVNTGNGMLAFEAHVSGARLQLILVQIGPDGTPLVDQGQELIFTRIQGAAPASAGAAIPGLSRGTGAAAAADPFVGNFTNGELTLSLQSADGGYSGRLALGQEAYPVTARRNGDRVEGTLNAANGQYGIVITASSDGVVLSNAGTDYALKRIPDAANGTPSGTNANTAAAANGAAGQAAGSVDNSPLAQQWRAHLAGKKVTYMSSYSSNTAGGGGLNTKFVYHLCSDGRFAFSGSNVVSMNLPPVGAQGGGSAGSSSGTWRIVTQGQVAGIELRFGNGQTELYRLDMQGSQTFANGDRVYVTPGEICR